jgi:hypothetical protein
MVIARIEFFMGLGLHCLVDQFTYTCHRFFFSRALQRFGGGLGWAFGGYWGYAVRGVPEGMDLGWDYMMVNQTTN